MLRIENGIMVNIPNTLGVENVMQVINNRCKKGNSHIVAYTNPKALKKARTENMDLVKITDINCMLGKPKKKTTETTNTENATHREPTFTRLDNVFIQYNNGDVAIMTQPNKHFKAKSYYVDKNTGRVYDKQYLKDNGYISSSESARNENETIFMCFKANSIIYIK